MGELGQLNLAPEGVPVTVHPVTNLFTAALVAFSILLAPVVEASSVVYCKAKQRVHTSSCCSKSTQPTKIAAPKESCCRVVAGDATGFDWNVDPVESPQALRLNTGLLRAEDFVWGSSLVVSLKRANAPPTPRLTACSVLCRFLI
jgi:hypothetical protein